MKPNLGAAMTKKTFYEKRGRRYVPVAEYDNEWLDSFPKGTHLVMSYPGGSTRRFNIDPAFAPMIAAGRYAEDAMAKALVHAGEIRMQRGKVPLTEGQKAAWENLVQEFGDSARQLEWPSAREVAEAGVKAMMDDAEETLKNPAVRKAWDYFMMVYQLTKENHNE
jgi:hypothetical protein